MCTQADWKKNIYITTEFNNFENKTYFKLWKQDNDELLITGSINCEIGNFFSFDNLEINSYQRILSLIDYANDDELLADLSNVVGNTKLEIRDTDYDKIVEFTSSININSKLIKYLNKTLSFKRQQCSVEITVQDIIEAHNLVVETTLSKKRKKFRNNEEATYDLCSMQEKARMPKWQEVTLLMDKLIEWLNSDKIKRANPLIVAALFQYIFLKIHPFSDGNGRTIRALVLLLLMLRANFDLNNFSLYLSKVGRLLLSIAIYDSIFVWTNTFIGVMQPALQLKQDRFVYKFTFLEKTLKLKNAIFALLLFASLMRKIEVAGHIHDSANGIPSANSLVRFFRKPSGESKDTLLVNANSNTHWTIFTENFEHDAHHGDTLYIEVEKSSLGRQFSSRTYWIIRRGVNVSQFVRNAHNGYSAENASVRLVRRPLSGIIDTIYTTVWYGMWATHGANFNPALGVGNTLDVYINKQGYTARTRYIIPSTVSQLLPDVHIDNPNKPPRSRTPIIRVVKDTSKVNAPLYGIFTLKKNQLQPCSALVDTSSGPDRVYDWFINTEFQDSTVNHGDSAFVILRKRVGNITYTKQIRFTIDTLRHFDVTHIKSNGNTGSDTIIFPEEILIGINEKKLENIVDEGRLIKGPNIMKGGSDIVLNVAGDYYLYDILGREVLKGKGNEINTYGLPNGAYFLFLKPKDGELYKPEKVLILK